MNDLFFLLAAALGGAALALFYFGGLWWTIQRAQQAAHPAGLLLGSFLLRSAILLPGFYLLWGGRFERLAFSLLAFFVTRFFIIRRLRPMPTERNTHSHGNQP